MINRGNEKNIRLMYLFTKA